MTNTPIPADTDLSPPIPTIGIAWRTHRDTDSFRNFCHAVELAGARYVLLEQVISEDFAYDEQKHLREGVAETGALTEEAGQHVRSQSWQASNAAEILRNIQAVLFTGGEDISPSLYRVPEPWHGIPEDCNYHAERDISDYLLMSYCLDHDIPHLAVCRSMQMLGIVSGASMIQDIPSFFSSLGLQDHGDHRQVLSSPTDTRDYVPVDILVRKGTLLYQMTHRESLHGCPCWHHQAVRSVDGTPLLVSGYTETQGIRMIEAIERPDKRFSVGLQFHPEVSVGKNQRKAANQDSFLDLKTAVVFFERLAAECRSPA